MSEQEQDCLLGRVTREYSDASKELAALEVSLEKQRELYARLVKCLSGPGEPKDILFDNERIDIEAFALMGRKESDYRFISEHINGAKLKALCAEIREKRAVRESLAAQLAKLGVSL
jgi:type III secretory pathway component EscV